MNNLFDTDDPIKFWNAVALEVHRRDFTFDDAFGDDESGAPMDRQMFVPQQGGPTRTSRALAMVHLAMYDAWRAFHTGIGAPYLTTVGPAPAGASDRAAVGGAARQVLTGLFDRQVDYLVQKTTEWDARLWRLGVTPTEADAGDAYGVSIGQQMLNVRQSDGSQIAGAYAPSNPGKPGVHRPDPYASNQGFLHPAWGQVTPFGVAIPTTSFKLPFGAIDATDLVQKAEWAEQVEEVRVKGASADYVDLTRTPEQTVIGIFWGYDGARDLGTPPRLYIQNVRVIADQLGLSEDVNAKLFALVNMAMADAGIAAWGEKYTFNVWRPVLGVREAAGGYGPMSGSSVLAFDPGKLPLPLPVSYDDVEDWLETEPDRATTTFAAGMVSGTTNSDPTWAPLGAPQTNTTPGLFYRTPNFPAYPSGHATFGAACFQTVYNVLLDEGVSTEDELRDLEVVFISDEFPVDQQTRPTLDPDGSQRTPHLRRMTLAQAIHENAVSRIYLGVHWRIDAIEGTRLGNEIAAGVRTKLNSPDPYNGDQTKSS
jgi:hypothetical protein